MPETSFRVVVAVDMSLYVQVRGMWDQTKATALATCRGMLQLTGVHPHVIAYTQQARLVDIDELERPVHHVDLHQLRDLGFDFGYGANVQTALKMSREILQGAGTNRVCSLPTPSRLRTTCPTAPTSSLTRRSTKPLG